MIFIKIVVAGTGYVGLVTGTTLAHIGHNVTCVDVDKNKIALLNSGISVIAEEGLEKLMKDNKTRLTYTTNYKNAYKDVDVIFIAVGTPERVDGSADLGYIDVVVKQISESVSRDCVVVIKSTVPIGTNDCIEKKLRQMVKENVNISVVSNPEFLAQGTAVKDSLYASRIVVGVEDEVAKNVMLNIYLPFTKEPYNVPYLCMSRKSAEMVKYASNDFLALKISFVNEIANFCELVGANIDDVTCGMGYDSRIGNKFLKVGIGYGGSCFPKDTEALYFLGKTFATELKTIKACIEVNKSQKIKLFKKLQEDYKSLIGLKVAVLGLTFKPGTDDVREAPSIDNILLLLNNGADVRAYDPIGISNFEKELSRKIDFSKTIGTIQYFQNIDDSIKDADVVLIMTEWSDITNYDLNKYVSFMSNPTIYDGRNCYNLEMVKTKNINYYSIGR